MSQNLDTGAATGIGSEGGRGTLPDKAEAILAAAVEHFGLPSGEGAHLRKRDNRAVRAKHTAAWTMRHKLGMSYPEIARAMGARSHQSPMQWCKDAPRLGCADDIMAASVAVWERIHRPGPIVARRARIHVDKFDEGIDAAIQARLEAGLAQDGAQPQPVGISGADSPVQPLMSVVLMPEGSTDKAGRVRLHDHSAHPLEAVDPALQIATRAVEYAVEVMDRLGHKPNEIRGAIRPLVSRLREIDRDLMLVD